MYLGAAAGQDDDIINCDCGQPSARRTAMKDGPNKGRDFYCCGKPRDEQCRFFSWADEDQASTSNYNQVRFDTLICFFYCCCKFS